MVGAWARQTDWKGACPWGPGRRRGGTSVHHGGQSWASRGVDSVHLISQTTAACWLALALMAGVTGVAAAGLPHLPRCPPCLDLYSVGYPSALERMANPSESRCRAQQRALRTKDKDSQR